MSVVLGVFLGVLGGDKVVGVQAFASSRLAYKYAE